jgi:hypothetical protein
MFVGLRTLYTVTLLLYCSFRPTGFGGPELPPFEHSDGCNGIDLCLLKQIPGDGE